MVFAHKARTEEASLGENGEISHGFTDLLAVGDSCCKRLRLRYPTPGIIYDKARSRGC